MDQATAKAGSLRADVPRTAVRRPRAATAGSRTGATLRDDSPVAYNLVWLTCVVLLIAGLCMVLSVSVARVVSGGQKYGLFKPQAIAAVIGLVLLFGISRLDYRRLRPGFVVRPVGSSWVR